MVPSLLMIGGSMDLAIVTWAIAALVIAALLPLTRLRARTLAELRHVLYRQGNAALYLSLLDNPHLRVIFSQRALAELRAEGERVLQGAKASDRKDD